MAGVLSAVSHGSLADGISGSTEELFRQLYWIRGAVGSKDLIAICVRTCCEKADGKKEPIVM